MAARARVVRGERGTHTLKAARIAADHAGEAVEVLVHLMRTSKRDSVRKDAATAVIALALQAAPDLAEGDEGRGELRLVSEPEAIEEARRRLAGG